MRLSILASLPLFTACAPASVQSRGAAALPDESHELVVVTTDGWDDVSGSLQRFERNAPAAAWRRVGSGVPVVVGRNGLAWGRGLLGGAAGDGPVKREGDGRAPAGAFALSSAFGFAPADSLGWIRLPYHSLTPATECVDDTASAHYNTLVERDRVPSADWASAERMRSVPQYRLGVFVDHNSGAERRPGGGSCIFLHIWAGPSTGTAGCTAMDAPRLEELVRWLAPERRPVLVQLPRGEYERLRGAWGLPAI